MNQYTDVYGKEKGEIQESKDPQLYVSGKEDNANHQNKEYGMHSCGHGGRGDRKRPLFWGMWNLKHLWNTQERVPRGSQKAESPSRSWPNALSAEGA